MVTPSGYIPPLNPLNNPVSNRTEILSKYIKARHPEHGSEAGPGEARIVCSLKTQIRQVWLSKSLAQIVGTLSRFSAGIRVSSAAVQKQIFMTMVLGKGDYLLRWALTILLQILVSADMVISKE